MCVCVSVYVSVMSITQEQFSFHGFSVKRTLLKFENYTKNKNFIIIFSLKKKLLIETEIIYFNVGFKFNKICEKRIGKICFQH